MEMTVKTNKIPRPIICGYELTNKEKEEFDYLKSDEIDSAEFFRYKGRIHYLGNYMRYNQTHNGVVWHGAESDSFFSGTFVHLCDDSENIIVGRYCS